MFHTRVHRKEITTQMKFLARMYAANGENSYRESFKPGPLWGRFYDLENCEVFVCDRDGIPRHTLEEIGSERRNGYSWYNTRPAELFPLYQEWKARWNEKNAQ